MKEGNYCVCFSSFYKRFSRKLTYKFSPFSIPHKAFFTRAARTVTNVAQEIQEQALKKMVGKKEEEKEEEKEQEKRRGGEEASSTFGS